jgi:uncharacterized protein (DUF1697 family)
MIALLRAINVGGRNSVKMAELKAMMEGLGLSDVRTLLQSGNVVFEGQTTEAALEAALKKKTGVEADFVLRTPAEWKKLIAGNPFPQQAKDDPGHLVAFCMKAAPKAADVKALQDAIKGNEQIAAKGNNAYIWYPDGIGRSKLTVALIEKKLNTRGTGRNWNTVLKLADLHAAS